jgi:AraC-like DNA-binding protein
MATRFTDFCSITKWITRRKLLDSGSYNVNEVGSENWLQHRKSFIAAFKKKFATTPKKYLMSINPNT